MKITQEQKKKIMELERWFAGEVAKLKKRQVDILKAYDKKKTALMQARVRKHIDKFDD